MGVNFASSENLVKEIKTQAQKSARYARCLELSCLEKQIYEIGNKIICTRQLLEAIDMKLLRKIVRKTKIGRIRNQQIRES